VTDPTEQTAEHVDSPTAVGPTPDDIGKLRVLNPMDGLGGMVQAGSPRMAASSLAGTSLELPEQATVEDQFEFGGEVDLSNSWAVPPLGETLSVPHQAAGSFEEFFEVPPHSGSSEQLPTETAEIPDRPAPQSDPQTDAPNVAAGMAITGDSASFFAKLWALFRASGGIVRQEEENPNGSSRGKTDNPRP